MEVILVALWRPADAETLLNAAARLATLSDGAHLSVLATAEPIASSGFAAEALIEEADAVESQREAARQRIAALRATFDRWSSEARTVAVSTRWIAEEGSIAAIIGERGARADVIVTAQPTEADRELRLLFRAALLGTDRPVLIVPAGAPATFGRRIAIAWRDDKRAASAVLPALRCIASAENVDVLIGVRAGAPSPGMPRILLEHGIRADLHVLPIGATPFGHTLLEAAHELGADLLVMGAYAHNPLRELILGGVTRYIATHADLPVLMRH